MVAALLQRPPVGKPCVLATTLPNVTNGIGKAARKQISKVWKSKKQNLDKGFGLSAVKKPFRFLALPTYAPCQPLDAAFARMLPRASSAATGSTSSKN